jgi:hypothetical protein
MIKNVTKFASLCTAIIISGCSIFVESPTDTTVEARNELVDLSVKVDNVTTNVSTIDLYDVEIGDAFFTSIKGGVTTVEKTLSTTGDVDIVIGRASVGTKVLGQTVYLDFTDIDTMTTSIHSGTTNTVVFNESTAGVIFTALAKKKAR